MDVRPTKVELIWEGHEYGESNSSEQQETDVEVIPGQQSSGEIDLECAEETQSGMSIRRTQLQVFAYSAEYPSLPTSVESGDESSPRQLQPGILPLPFNELLSIEKIFFMLNDQRDEVRPVVHPKIPPGDKNNCFMLVDNSENAERHRQNARMVFEDDRGAWKITNRTSSFYLIRNKKLTLIQRRERRYYIRRREDGQSVYVPILPAPPEELVVKLAKYYSSQGDYLRRITWIENDVLDNPRAVVEYKGTFTHHQPHGNSKRKRSVYIRAPSKRASTSSGLASRVAPQSTGYRAAAARKSGNARQGAISAYAWRNASTDEVLSRTDVSGAEGAGISSILESGEMKKVYLTIHTDEKILSMRTFRVPEVLVSALCRSSEQESLDEKRASSVPLAAAFEEHRADE